MAKKKTTRPQGRPPGRKVTVAVYARIDPELAEAWMEYVEEQQPRTSSNAMLELLIEQRLRERGRWPRKKQPPSSEN